MRNLLLNGHTLKILVNNDLEGNKFSITTKDIIENNIEEKETISNLIEDNSVKPSKKKNKKKRISVVKEKDKKKVSKQTNHKKKKRR